MVAQPEVRFNLVLDGVQVGLFHAHDLTLEERPCGYISQRRSLPEAQRVLKDLDGVLISTVAQRPTPLRAKALVAMEIESARVGLEYIAARHRHQDLVRHDLTANAHAAGDR